MSDSVVSIVPAGGFVLLDGRATAGIDDHF